jgi:RNA polymerase sigma-70 factor (ECF subfamily)
VAKFVRAYEAGDIDALLALLTADVLVSMPPIPLEYQGLDVVARFYAGLIGQGRTYDFVLTRANGQPALGTYIRAATGIRHGAGLLVLTLTGDRIGAITRFDNGTLPPFGLPRSLPGWCRVRRHRPGAGRTERAEAVRRARGVCRRCGVRGQLSGGCGR